MQILLDHFIILKVKNTTHLLTVHVSLVFVLDEGIATWFARPLVVYYVDLEGKNKDSDGKIGQERVENNR